MKKPLCLFIALAVVLAVLPGLGKAQNEKAYLLNYISVLNPDQIPRTPAGVRHILLIGMDKWQNNPENPGYNDGLVLLTFDELAGRVIVTSLIRDMLVIRPDGSPGRINRMVRQYDVQALMDTINTHFGLEVTKYVLMDWRHIMEIVDAAGGVDVHLTSDEVHYLKNWAVPLNSTQPVLDKAGDYHLNGFSAVIYMRIRKHRASNNIDTQDFGRTFRVRNVLSELAGNLRNYDITAAQDLLTKVLTIWDQPFDKEFTYPGIRNNGIFTYGIKPKDPQTRRYATNISMLDLMDSMHVAFLLRDAEIEQCLLPFDGTVKPYTYAGGAGQLVEFQRNRELLHAFMFPESFIVVDENPPREEIKK
jgi:LCP family protein required for cell wall assembly